MKDFTDRHPVVTGIGAALIIGSVAASAGGGKSRDAHDVTLPPDPCAQPEACR